MIFDDGKYPVEGSEGIENTSEFKKREMLKTVKVLENYKKFAKVKIEKLKKLANGLYDKIKSLVSIKNLKQVLNHGLILIKVYEVIKFNRKYYSKSYIDINTKIRTKVKTDFEKLMPYLDSLRKM